jgi:ABC-type Na+ efflux pump permease subunit
MIWTLAKKDLRLLLRDRRAIVILLAMPFIFILVLGLSLGEGFGQKPDDRLRISLVDLDQGIRNPDIVKQAPHGGEAWSKVVQTDLAETAGIRVEIIPSLEEAQHLVAEGKRAAVLVFGPDFSDKVSRCSFLAGGVNPLYRDGIKFAALDAQLLSDKTQLTASSIIDQALQVTFLRVVLPWMIGRAFQKIGEVDFIEKLSQKVHVPVPALGSMRLDSLVRTLEQKQAIGTGVQNALQSMFPNYNLTGKTWAALTRSEPREGGGAAISTYQEEGAGLLKRGAMRYQILVPSYTVMFAFFLVLTVGWLFVGERRQGTLKRLRAAPLTRTDILLGKMVPCYVLSLFQGFFLLGAGKLVFDMSWGSQPLWVIPVVCSTSLAAMGLALLVAAVAQTETQVAIYGTLLVVVLAGVSGCLMGDRELMPETMQQISRFTPHAWALIAYKQLLANPASPNIWLVGESCAVLAGFGVGFVVLAWWALRLD